MLFLEADRRRRLSRSRAPQAPTPRPTTAKRKPADSLDLAVRALARRDYSRGGLEARLERAGVDEKGRAETVDRLAEAGYVDDERFAAARAGQLAERGQGDAAIRWDLERQGAGAEAVDRALAGLPPELDRARATAASLGGGLKAARALARKGFAAESIEAAVDIAPDAC